MSRMPALPVVRQRAHRRYVPTTGRRARLLLAGGNLLLGIVALVLLALPLLSVRGDAETAKSELTAALAGLEAGHLRSAREHVAAAREHVDAASADTTGIGADVWGALPLVGTAVDDVGHLVSA